MSGSVSNALGVSQILLDTNRTKISVSKFKKNDILHESNHSNAAEILLYELVGQKNDLSVHVGYGLISCRNEIRVAIIGRGVVRCLHDFGLVVQAPRLTGDL
jgi:hypothetical protein